MPTAPLLQCQVSECVFAHFLAQPPRPFPSHPPLPEMTDEWLTDAAALHKNLQENSPVTHQWWMLENVGPPVRCEEDEAAQQGAHKFPSRYIRTEEEAAKELMRRHGSAHYLPEGHVSLCPQAWGGYEEPTVPCVPVRFTCPPLGTCPPWWHMPTYHPCHMHHAP